MNPRAELRQLIDRLLQDLASIKSTLENTLRITDRRRELVRAMALLARLEGRTTQTSKVRDHWQALDPGGAFPAPTPETDPDMFLGTDGEDTEAVNPVLDDPFTATDEMTARELRTVEQRPDGWFTFVPEEDEPRAW